jgi:hypothetical protein
MLIDFSSSYRFLGLRGTPTFLNICLRGPGKHQSESFPKSIGKDAESSLLMHFIVQRLQHYRFARLVHQHLGLPVLHRLKATEESTRHLLLTALDQPHRYQEELLPVFHQE